MKKKVLFGITAAALAAVMCVGFSACGGNAESVRGEEVTEKQWNSALDYFTEEDAVYKIECREEQVEERKFEYIDEILSGGATCVQTIEAVKNGTKEYVKQTKKLDFSGDYKKIAAALDQEIEETDEEDETYAESKDGVITVYSKDDNEKWTTNKGYSSIAYGKIREVLSNMSISLSYSSYEYSNDLMGYILKDSQKRDSVYVLKFNGDGKLCAIYFEYETVTKSGNREHTMKDMFDVVISYKAENITLPTVK